ncbi:glycosyl transferase [Bacteroidia bacterium]|nr:glycosyl transferase [Bacteroidia bacterium]
MNKITFIAQFPPPIHGLSKAVETLWLSELQNKYVFEKIDITNNKSILKNLIAIMHSKSDLSYFTISQTKAGNWRDLAILKLLGWKKKNCLIHLHGGYYRTLIDEDCGAFQQKLNYQALKKVAGCIVLGNSLIPIFKGLIDDSKIYIVPNCVDNDYLADTDDLTKKLDNVEKQNQLHILYLSNFIETKGYKNVLSLALVAKEKQEKRIHFHFAGKFFREEEKNYFHSFIEQNSLSDYVTYHGVVSGQSKIDLLNLCHIFILLTRYPNEGQPISILEAMANGMAIVTTNHAGIPDIVTDGKNGLVVDKNGIDLAHIFSYFIDILKDNNLLKTTGTINCQTAMECYTEKQYITNIDKIFEKLCHQK